MKTKIKKIIIEDENGKEQELDVSHYTQFTVEQETGVKLEGPIAIENGHHRMQIRLWRGSSSWERFRTDFNQ